jgi:glycosyltransferase involved in cell wall biosynthesis
MKQGPAQDHFASEIHHEGMIEGKEGRPELFVVLPVYNERESIGHVLGGWLAGLDASGCDYRMLAIDDGSTDDTRELLEGWMKRRPDRLEILSRGNRGHGLSCLEGYREAIRRGADYILQIDSDGQSLPEHFAEFWSVRDRYDVIYGRRTRSDGWQRVGASLVLRALLRVLEGVDCIDANVPYRLMRVESCKRAILGLSDGISLSNVALAVALRRQADIRHGAVAIRFPPRFGGEPSVPLSRFLVKAIELFKQLRRHRKSDPS